MGYKIIVSPRAQQEMENAIDYYALYSATAPQRFVQEVEKAYQALKVNPLFALCYKNVRTLKIKRFPYSLFFTLDETSQTVRILACFHNKRNPKENPGKD